MLKEFGFRRKMYYLCTSEEEGAHRQRVFSSFFAEKGQKNHCFTKHLGNFICRRKISTCFCGFFSGQVGAQIDDIESRKVKRYLFSNLHFFKVGSINSLAIDSRLSCRRFLFFVRERSGLRDRMKNKKIRCESRKGIQVI